MIQPTISALADQDLLIVVATGGRPVGELRMALPDNVRVAEMLPYSELLPKTAVMVTNGGYGGVQKALANGVPLVVAGAREDKPEVAAPGRVVRQRCQFAGRAPKARPNSRGGFDCFDQAQLPGQRPPASRGNLQDGPSPHPGSDS